MANSNAIVNKLLDLEYLNNPIAKRTKTLEDDVAQRVAVRNRTDLPSECVGREVRSVHPLLPSQYIRRDDADQAAPHRAGLERAGTGAACLQKL